MNHLRLFSAMVLLLGMTILAGCVSLERPAPEVRQFKLEVERPGGMETPPAGAPALALGRFSAVPEVQVRGFVFRVSDAEVKEDYYNRWVSEPADALLEEMAGWLMASPVVGEIGATTSPGIPYVLYGHLSDWHADVRGEPAVVARMSFSLFARNEGREMELRAQWQESERVAVDRVTPEALVAGWNTAAASLLGRLEARLAEEFAKR